MSASNGYGSVVMSGSVFMFDTGDTVNSYKGEPTTNSMNFTDNVTGSNYGFNIEYSACQLSKAWYPNIQTPVGTGATLLTQQNSGSSPWYGLNWYDSEEDGKRCLSAYIYPVTPITQLRFGMAGDANNSVYFNIATREITYGAYITNTNAFIQDVPGYPGWLRVGANIEGRAGGWVLFLGTGFEVDYTPTEPYESFYICGIQYERTIATHCTQFTPAGTTRSATQGLIPLVGSQVLDLTNISYNSNAQITFDGTNDRISTGLGNIGNNVSFTAVINSSGNATTYNMYMGQLLPYMGAVNGNAIIFSDYINSTQQTITTIGGSITTGQNHYVVCTREYDGTNTTNKIYIDGQLKASGTFSGAPTYYGDTIYIGDGQTSVWYPFYGYVKTAQIYNRTLTVSEITQNYQKYKTRFNLS